MKIVENEKNWTRLKMMKKKKEMEIDRLVMNSFVGSVPAFLVDGKGEKSRVGSRTTSNQSPRVNALVKPSEREERKKTLEKEKADARFTPD